MVNHPHCCKHFTIALIRTLSYKYSTCSSGLLRKFDFIPLQFVIKSAHWTLALASLKVLAFCYGTAFAVVGHMQCTCTCILCGNTVCF